MSKLLYINIIMTSNSSKVYNSNINKYENNQISYANGSFSVTTPIVIALTQNVYALANCNYTIDISRNFTQPTNGVLQYTGTKPKLFNCMYDIQGNIQSNLRQWKIALYRDTGSGFTKINNTDTFTIGRNTGQISNCHNNFLLQLNQNDKLAIYVANSTNSDDFDLSGARLILQEFDVNY